ncbi:substrate-binding domain-containing protein [Lentisphaera profundi]|uniref:Substrate-binding domain-containing protein n=1 Tax=Lentisphaera profundi TaxID=1658616 RepID=A0ABY7VTN7_9BACT|nr:substrate-binding domain-containing protein [Lentisphaera profundi]WDE96114.1 substrate-binding domain-containing protein [Lentisphaera profundi]
MISMQELADICGYSRVSVSAALNGKGGISEKAREKILGLAKEHNYTPNKMAHALKGLPSQLIGMLIRDLSNPFYTQMIKIIDDHLHKEGYSLIVLNSMADAERERKAIQTLYSYNVDGLFIAPFAKEKNSDRIDSLINSHSKPVIMLDNLSRDIGSMSIGFNNRSGAKDATQYLIDCGHRKITYLAGPESSLSYQERSAGFVECMNNNKITMSTDTIYPCGSSAEEGYSAALSLLSQTSRPSALFCFNDYIAIGVYRAAQELKLNIPTDLSIIGFDNINLTKLLSPSLTSVSIHIDKVAADAADNMLKFLNDENTVIP